MALVSCLQAAQDITWLHVLLIWVILDPAVVVVVEALLFSSTKVVF